MFVNYDVFQVDVVALWPLWTEAENIIPADLLVFFARREPDLRLQFGKLTRHPLDLRQHFAPLELDRHRIGQLSDPGLLVAVPLPTEMVKFAPQRTLMAEAALIIRTKFRLLKLCRTILLLLSIMLVAVQTLLSFVAFAKFLLILAKRQTVRVIAVEKFAECTFLAFTIQPLHADDLLVHRVGHGLGLGDEATLDVCKFWYVELI